MPIRNKKQVIQRLRDRADKYVRALALEGHKRLMQKTPVDTGRARANWNVAIDAPDRSIRPVKADAGQSGTDWAAIREAQAEGLTTIAEFRAGQVLYLTNAVPYVPRLEDGHSKQAPQGMVKLTVAELKPLASRIAAKIAADGE